jgi:hypothetical protein
MTSTTPPISTAAEQDHHQYDNQDQFHGISPLMVAALFFRHLSNQRPPHRIVPMAALWDSEQTSRSRRYLTLASTATLSTRRPVA